MYQVHEWDGQAPLEETLQALDLLVASGKVRYVGASNYASWQLTDRGEPPVYDTEGLYDIIDVLIKTAEQHGVSAAQVALAYTLARPAVTSLVIGARTDEQLADNLAAASLTLLGPYLK